MSYQEFKKELKADYVNKIQQSKLNENCSKHFSVIKGKSPILMN